MNFGFFENLFNQSAFGEFKVFIDQDLQDPDFDTSYNVSPKASGLSVDTHKLLARNYKGTYDYINQRFNGAAEKFWNNNYLLSQKE